MFSVVLSLSMLFRSVRSSQMATKLLRINYEIFRSPLRYEIGIKVVDASQNIIVLKLFLISAAQTYEL